MKNTMKAAALVSAVAATVLVVQPVAAESEDTASPAANTRCYGPDWARFAQIRDDRFRNRFADVREDRFRDRFADVRDDRFRDRMERRHSSLRQTMEQERTIAQQQRETERDAMTRLMQAESTLFEPFPFGAHYPYAGYAADPTTWYEEQQANFEQLHRASQDMHRVEIERVQRDFGGFYGPYGYAPYGYGVAPVNFEELRTNQQEFFKQQQEAWKQHQAAIQERMKAHRGVACGA